MPEVPKRPCRHPGCGDYAVSGARCARHQREREQARGSASARGYDRAWQRVRAAYLVAHPLCAQCQAAGAVTAATQVHHVVRVRTDETRRLDWRNLEALCESCHSRITLVEDVGRRVE